MLEQNINRDEITVNSFLLASFFGIFGIHSFYNRKILLGILQLFTLGGFFIWWLIDLCLLASGKYKADNVFLEWGGKKDSPAGFKVRCCAFIIDIMIIHFAFLFIFSFPFFLQNVLDHFMMLFLFDNIVRVDYCLYSIICYMFFRNNTIGKSLCKIKLVSQDGKKLGALKIIFRQIILLLSLICMILLLVIAFNKNKYGIHDFLARTKVLYS